jgi:hypothetical protein
MPLALDSIAIGPTAPRQNPQDHARDRRVRWSACVCDTATHWMSVGFTRISICVPSFLLMVLTERSALRSMVILTEGYR